MKSVTQWVLNIKMSLSMTPNYIEEQSRPRLSSLITQGKGRPMHNQPPRNLPLHNQPLRSGQAPLRRHATPPSQIVRQLGQAVGYDLTRFYVFHPITRVSTPVIYILEDLRRYGWEESAVVEWLESIGL